MAMIAPKKLVKTVTCSIILGLVALAVYAAFWAVWYRIPAGPHKSIDLRAQKTEEPRYISFCASLAENPHGYPGHCYVVWTEGPPKDLLSAESASFMPAQFWDQLPALWTFVPGFIQPHSARGNLRNLDMLTVTVSKTMYEKSRVERARWDSKSFRVGHRDCVSFANNLALSIGLRTPAASYRYPQDYLRELKQLN